MAIRPSYCTELDAFPESNIRRVNLCLKWSLLFCRQLVIIESQLVYNRNLAPVLQSTDFRELIQSADAKNVPHVIASVRWPDIDRIVSAKIDADNKGERAVVFQLPGKMLGRYETLKQNRGLTLDAFYDSLGLRRYFETVQELFLDTKHYHVFQRNLSNYTRDVLSAINDAEQTTLAEPIRNVLRSLRDEISHKPEIIRSELWRVVDCANLSRDALDFVTKFILVLPYSRDIASSSDFQMVYSSDFRPSHGREIASKLSRFQSRAWELDSQIAVADVGFEEIERLNFGQIARIRERSEFLQNISAIETELEQKDARSAAKALSEHVRFLDSAISHLVGPGVRPKVNGFVDLFVRTAQTYAASHIPLSGPSFTKLTDLIMLWFRSPRQQALKTVSDMLLKRIDK
jgi:hypothetical protein